MFEKKPVSQDTTPAIAVSGEVDPVTTAVEPNEDQKQQEEKTYTAADVERIVRERVVRQNKQWEKKLAESQPQKPSQNVEEDARQKLQAAEERHKVLQVKLEKFRVDGLRAQVSSKLAEAGCIDPGDVTDVLLARNLVHLDDDDQIVTENVTNSLDDLVRDYLSRKPHLVKPSQANGLGTRGPAKPAVMNSDPKQMSTDELAAAMGMTKKKSKKLFGDN
jgi:hypothetical protein